MRRVSTGYLTPKSKKQSITSKEPSTSPKMDNNMIHALMQCPDTKKMILELLADNKDAIENYKKQNANSNKVCTSSGKKRRTLEGPIALARRRALEEMEGKSPRRANSRLSSTTSNENVASHSNAVPLNKIFDGVIAYVEIQNKDKDRSHGVKYILKSMGAVIRETFSNDVTHVIFKDGAFQTYQKAKLLGVHFVSVLWIEVSRNRMCRQSEKLYPALGADAYTDDPSMICSQLQKEYEDIVQDELRRSFNNNIPFPDTHQESEKRKTQTLTEDDSNTSFHTVQDNSSNILNDENKLSSFSSSHAAGSDKNSKIDHSNDINDEKEEEVVCKNNELAVTNKNSSGSRRSKRSMEKSKRQTVLGIFFSEETNSTSSTSQSVKQSSEHCNISESSDSIIFPSRNCVKTIRKDSPCDFNASHTEELKESMNGIEMIVQTPEKFTDKKNLAIFLHENKSSISNQLESYQNSLTKKKGKSSSKNTKALSSSTSKLNSTSSKKSYNDLMTDSCDNLDISLGSNNSLNLSNTSTRKSFRLLTKTGLKSNLFSENISPINHITEDPVNVDQDDSDNSTDSEIITNLKHSQRKPINRNSINNVDMFENSSENSRKSFKRSSTEINKDGENNSNSSLRNTKIIKNDTTECDSNKNTIKTRVRRKLYNPNEPILPIFNDDEERQERKATALKKNTKKNATVKEQSKSAGSKTTEKLPINEMIRNNIREPSVEEIETLFQPEMSKKNTKKKNTDKNEKKKCDKINSQKSVHQDGIVQSRQTQTPLTCPKTRRSSFEFQLVKKSAKKMKKTETEPPSIVCTGFNRIEVRKFNSNVKKLGKFVIENKVTSRTTHLIAAEPKRTVNMLRAIARGCWILKNDWILSSLKSKRWLPEENYEVTEFSSIVQKSRLERHAFGSNYRLDIFKNCGGIYVSLRTSPSYVDLKELITLCQGETVNTARVAKIIIGDYFTYEDVVCLNEKWILDCITVGKKLPFNDIYLINEKITRRV